MTTTTTTHKHASQQQQHKQHKQQQQRSWFLTSLFVFIIGFVAFFNQVSVLETAHLRIISKDEHVVVFFNNNINSNNNNTNNINNNNNDSNGNDIEDMMSDKTTYLRHRQDDDGNDDDDELPSIAVCITGMPERLQPWHVFQHLVAANNNNNNNNNNNDNNNKFREFHVIFAMGEHSKLTYSSRPDATFAPTRYANYKTTQQLTDELQKEARRFGIEFEISKFGIDNDSTTDDQGNNYSSSSSTSNTTTITRSSGHNDTPATKHNLNNGKNNLKLSVLPFIHDLMTSDEWKEKLNISTSSSNDDNYNNTNDLDRISQYVGDTQINILNMYNHQVECANYIERLEARDKGENKKFDWIISTREDSHYFNDIDLKGLLMIHTSNSNLDNHRDDDDSDDDKTCDLITKDCLDFNGINMRFQLLRRKHGLEFLKSRLDFYKSLYTFNTNTNDYDKSNRSNNDNNINNINNNNAAVVKYNDDAKRKKNGSGVTIRNPEMLEDFQAQTAGMKVCKRSISEIPVNVGRHTTNGDFCFLPYEVEGCVPLESVHFVNEKRCYPFEWNWKKKNE